MIYQKEDSVNKLFMNKENTEGSRADMASDGGANLFTGMEEISCIYYFCFQGNAVLRTIGVDTVNWVIFVDFIFLQGIQNVGHGFVFADAFAHHRNFAFRIYGDDRL